MNDLSGEQVEFTWQGQTVKVLADPAQHLQQSWIEGKFYEAAMLDHIWEEYVARQHIGGVWIDVGSSVGNHTLFFAMFCGLEYVISIEPRQSAMYRQYHNLKLNGVEEKAAPYVTAVSDWQGHGKMIAFGPENFEGMAKLSGPDDAMLPGQNAITPIGGVPVTSLDRLLPNADNIKLMKIDVEYHECQVLKGAQHLLEHCHPVLFVESVLPKNQRWLDEFLGAFGYKKLRRWNASATWEYVFSQG